MKVVVLHYLDDEEPPDLSVCGVWSEHGYAPFSLIGAHVAPGGGCEIVRTESGEFNLVVVGDCTGGECGVGEGNRRFTEAQDCRGLALLSPGDEVPYVVLWLHTFLLPQRPPEGHPDHAWSGTVIHS